VERLDFVTSPGHRSGSLRGAGPELVVTDLALLDFDNDDREMQLVSLHPGVTLDQVRAAVGWDLRTSSRLTETPPPTETELRLLREELDPNGLYRL
jgi:glutaconate CoA-transferase subunit B